MITLKGNQKVYSKDASIQPDAIVLTMPVAFFTDRGWTAEQFADYFERFMRDEDSIWNFRLTNLPKQEVAWVYLVFDGRVQFRVNLVMYERNVSKVFNDGPDGRVREFPNSNWVILAGPAERPPFEIPQKGFQGFRYSTKLF